MKVKTAKKILKAAHKGTYFKPSLWHKARLVYLNWLLQFDKNCYWSWYVTQGLKQTWKEAGLKGVAPEARVVVLNNEQARELEKDLRKPV